MADDNNIKRFTAVDIKKYHKGMLSANEMHDMEKAALDDPFLADALEGYNHAGVSIRKDIDELKNRLRERRGTGKVIPMHPGLRMVSNWWKAAAIIMLIGGGGFLVYRVAFLSNQKEIVQLENDNKSQPPVINDTLKNNQSVASTEINFSAPAKEKKINTKDLEIQKTDNYVVSSHAGSASQAMSTHMDSMGISALKKEIEFPLTVSPSSPVNEKSDKSNVASTQMKSLNKSSKPEADKDGAADELEKQKDGLLFQNKAVTNTGKKKELNRNNYFNGRVMDAENTPLPFANITNITDKVGTYSDAKGFFTLISPDSVLHVQIRSVGFENNNFELKSRIINNELVLREDRNSLSAIVMSNKKPNATRLQELRDANVKIEEPEPADGWDNYDTYLVNNLSIPDDKKIKQIEGQVEISFDINKIGKPFNFKIEKSLCKPCDNEAIRLVKEGPRWNKSGKKSRARLTVPFNK